MALQGYKNDAGLQFVVEVMGLVDRVDLSKLEQVWEIYKCLLSLAKPQGESNDVDVHEFSQPTTMKIRERSL